MRRELVQLSADERHKAVMSLSPTRSYSIAEASLYIGCSIRQVYNMMDDNRLKFVSPTPKCKHRKIKGIFIREAYLTFN